MGVWEIGTISSQEQRAGAAAAAQSVVRLREAHWFPQSPTTIVSRITQSGVWVIVIVIVGPRHDNKYCTRKLNYSNIKSNNHSCLLLLFLIYLRKSDPHNKQT